MKIHNNAVSGKILLIILLFIITNSSLSIAQEKTLYQRLGGYDAIAAVVDDFVAQLATDPSMSVFFKGHSTDSIKKIRMHIIDFICNAAGGPCAYTGRDMKTSHKGLGITEAQWNKSVEYLKNTLNKFKVPEKEQNELFAAVSSVKKDIVEKM
jgi:hemoglobin